jgi:hypothetical protein
MTKTCFRFFSITGYEAEEQWIHEMFLRGWKLDDVRFQCVYTFEKTEPADMAVRLEYSDVPPESRRDHEAMMKDRGWDCLCAGGNWYYFARPADPDPAENVFFSDDVSRLIMIQRIFQKRYLLLFLLLFFLIVPGIVFSGIKGGTDASFIGWIVLAGVYIIALVYCWLGFRRLMKKYSLKMEITPSVRGIFVCMLVVLADMALLIASHAAGGPFYDFWSSASPWVLGGVGILALMLYTYSGSIDEK